LANFDLLIFAWLFLIGLLQAQVFIICATNEHFYTVTQFLKTRANVVV